MDFPGLTPLFTLVSTILHAYIAIIATIGIAAQVWLFKQFLAHETRISTLEGKNDGGPAPDRTHV